MRDPPAEDRVGDQPDAMRLDHDGRVAEPRDPAPPAPAHEARCNGARRPGCSSPGGRVAGAVGAGSTRTDPSAAAATRISAATNSHETSEKATPMNPKRSAAEAS